MQKFNTSLLDEFNEFMIRFVNFDKEATYQRYEGLRDKLLTEYCDKGILCDWIIKSRYGSSLAAYFKKCGMTKSDKIKLITNSYNAMILKCSINNAMSMER